jgi:Cof subfamily protein (haloacid dehalogenase superfamily)
MSKARDIRLLLSDVDGTLVTNGKVLTEGALAAAEALRAAGVGFAITSSRPPRGLRMLIEPLALQQPLAGFNGGLMVGPDLAVIECHPLDALVARTAVDLLLSQGMSVWVYTEADWLVQDADGPHVAREAWILQFDATVVPTFADADLARAFKIVGVSDDHALVARVEKTAQEALGPTASATRSEPHFVDVTHPLANKGAVVTATARRLNILPEQIATIGDMPNDVLMFRQSGFSIAMGNASDEVKAQASTVTDSNENDGFAKAVRQLLSRSS